MEKVTIGEKEYEIKVLTRRDVRGKVTGLDADQAQDMLISLSTGITLEQLDELSLSDYTKLYLSFNRINGFGNLESFLQPQEKLATK